MADLQLRRLRAFVRVMELRGFSAASRSLNATQSTVSKAISQLEDQLGVRLFHRHGSRIEPTREGERVYDCAIRVLRESSDLLAAAAEMRDVRGGRLTIAVPRMGFAALLADAYLAFRRTYPGIDVELEPRRYGSLLEDVRTGAVDLGVVMEPLGPDLASRNFARGEWLAVVPESHEIAARRCVGLEELASQALMLPERAMRQHTGLDDVIRGARFDSHAATINHVELMFLLVARGAGVGLVPDAVAAHHERPQVRTVRIDSSPLRWSAVYAWHKDTRLSRAARAWLSLPIR